MAGDLLTRFRALPGAERVLGALADGEEVYAVGGTVRDLLLGRLRVEVSPAPLGLVSNLSKHNPPPTNETREDDGMHNTPRHNQIDGANNEADKQKTD